MLVTDKYIWQSGLL